MKATTLFCFCLALAGTLSEVQCLRKRPRRPSPSSARSHVQMGWRQNNGPCICPNTTTGPSPSYGPRRDQGQISHQGHMGPRPTGHHGPHGPRPAGHHGHHGPHSGPRPTGHHGHHGPHRGPRPTGHHGHHGPHSGPRPSGHHGHHGPRPTGHHSLRPRRLRYTRCVCGRQSERTTRIKFRMKETWNKALSDIKSLAYNRKSTYITLKLANVIGKVKRFTQMWFSKGSVIVEVGVVSDVPKSGLQDTEKALRDAMRSGEMKDMNVYPDSLAVEDTYSGVTLSVWSASENDCSLGCPRRGKHGRGKHGRGKHGDRHHRHHHVVRQTRTCTEIDASCDGIPLTRNASCEEACHKKSRIASCWGWGSGRFIMIACLAAVVVLVIIVVATIATVQKSRKKYIKTSRSTSSIKELAKNDELQFQSKC